MQLVQVADLREELGKYIAPDDDQYAEEIRVFADAVLAELAKVPQVAQVLFWDDQNGDDPELVFDNNIYDRRELLGDTEGHGLVWNAEGNSYYGATVYQMKSYPTARFAIALWFGGSPLNSAPGFYVIPVA